MAREETVGVTSTPYNMAIDTDVRAARCRVPMVRRSFLGYTSLQALLARTE